MKTWILLAIIALLLSILMTILNIQKEVRTISNRLDDWDYASQ